ncbi:RNA polymerase sigma factor [Wenzhouxiangella marina]|uniref:RNA polymerase sigma factor n=1 Tax=Wenzhouxiangella marina TaxID=1579979 RepID=A0A0K0XS55_9GAMM|nr:RNA polymerase sigma factor [Wenzhouxiangella marina]AKS40452.1 RNA polymerase sigma factor [Wenzhouxiangella marina]MBB6088226.1 RNA polymerase sigma-70 factor (ECF subfamily) [Wenzhouxiangella marina]
MSQATDDELMLAYAAGDAAAFDQLYERYRQPLYRYLLHAVGERALADDLYQDVWSRIIHARDGFERGNGFKRWAFRIAHNRLVDHWRKLDRQATDAAEGMDHLASDERGQPDSQAEKDEDARRLRDALMQLPRDQRQAFLLQQEAGLSLADIAEQDGVGRETIKSRLRYAVAKLRTALGPAREASGP